MGKTETGVRQRSAGNALGYEQRQNNAEGTGGWKKCGRVQAKSHFVFGPLSSNPRKWRARSFATHHSLTPPNRVVIHNLLPSLLRHLAPFRCFMHYCLHAKVPSMPPTHPFFELSFM
jgi:hypothetical protein